jgi:hypothetical protein
MCGVVERSSSRTRSPREYRARDGDGGAGACDAGSGCRCGCARRRERTGTHMAYNASTSPWSVVELRVFRWLTAGEGERLWIPDPGAVWGNGGRPLLGAAVYTPGEEVIVFLRRDVGRYFRTDNLAAGKLEVRRDSREAMVVQDTGATRERQIKAFSVVRSSHSAGERLSSSCSHHLARARCALVQLLRARASLRGRAYGPRVPV